MTHSPPVPQGNQSPYPLHQPPAAQTSGGPPPGVPVARRVEASHGGGAVVGILAAIGVGALVAGTAWIFGQSARPAKGKKARGKRSRRKR